MGRPATTPTRHVRVAEDLADKLGEILEVERGLSSADFLDPLIRQEIENRHKACFPAILALREAHERVRQVREDLLAHDLGENGGA